jgi:hypothetical protein
MPNDPLTFGLTSAGTMRASKTMTEYDQANEQRYLIER